MAFAITPNVATATTQTGNLSVSLTINDSCIVSASTLSFGSKGAADITGNIDATGSVNVTCTNGTSYSVALDDGLHASGSQRRMQSGSDLINYNLSSASAGGANWGSGSDVLASQTGTGVAQAITVYGRVPAQAAKAGTYADTVTVTVTY